MNPEYFIVPLIMGQMTHVINALKSGYILFDCCMFALLYILYYNVNVRTVKRRLLTIFSKQINKQTIVLTATDRYRTIKFRALMYHLATLNTSIYKIKEISELSWDDDIGRDIEKISEYVVDQSKEFILTDKIYGAITINSKEKQRGPIGTEFIEYNTMKIYSYELSLVQIQDWINSIVKKYKQHLKNASNEHQLYVTACGKKKSGGSSSGGGGGGGGGGDSEKNRAKSNMLSIEAVPWESMITFGNSYFHDMENVVKKIDFFLNNKTWYIEKGIPYNLGILLYGEPGCGKTRFIKQLMNHTGRHGIDIKLNDAMDFHDLYNIIYKEEISEDYIIPQNQRILIFEDIDAMGDAVKCRDMKADEQRKKKDAELSKVDTLASLLKSEDPIDKKDALLFSMLPIAQAQANVQANNSNLSYLLNMFDGINECSGRIIIMTSNKPEVLDKALIRPGRIDIKINFQKCTTYDAMRLINLFWDLDISESEILDDINMKYTSADIYNIFRGTNDFEEIKSQFLR